MTNFSVASLVPASEKSKKETEDAEDSNKKSAIGESYELSLIHI